MVLLLQLVETLEETEDPSIVLILSPLLHKKEETQVTKLKLKKKDSNLIMEES